MTSKQPKTKVPTDADLKSDPGIGSSKGMTSVGGMDTTGLGPADPEEIEADSTFEGDVENETTREGGIDPNHLGRTNK